MRGSNLLTGKGRYAERDAALALALALWLLRPRRARQVSGTRAQRSVDMCNMRASDVGVPDLDAGSSESAGGPLRSGHNRSAQTFGSPAALSLHRIYHTSRPVDNVHAQPNLRETRNEEVRIDSVGSSVLHTLLFLVPSSSGQVEEPQKHDQALDNWTAALCNYFNLEVEKKGIIQRRQ